MSRVRPEHWILVASLGAAAWWFTRKAPEPASPSEPPRRAPALASLPPGAQLLGRVDMGRVRQSGLGQMLTGSGRELAGLGSVQELCGFDPTEKIEELALATPAERSEEPALGIVATGDFEPARLLDCVAKIISRRGGTPAESKIGAFSSVRDRTRGGAEVAVKPGGPVLVGEGAYFRAMLDAADGRAPTLLGDEAHATLREAVGGYGALSVTFLARPGWLERWVPKEEAAGTPLADVRAGSLRVDLDPGPRAVLLLACPTAQSCEALGNWAGGLLRKTRDGLAIDPVSEAKVSVEKNAVRLSLAFDPLKLQKLVLALVLDDAADQ